MKQIIYMSTNQSFCLSWYAMALFVLLFFNRLSQNTVKLSSVVNTGSEKRDDFRDSIEMFLNGFEWCNQVKYKVSALDIYVLETICVSILMTDHAYVFNLNM